MALVDSLSLPPTTIVILGGTGNLAETKLLPALFDLYRRDALPSQFVVAGLSRKAWDDAAYQRYVAEAVTVARPHAGVGAVTAFASLCRYVRGDFDAELSYEKLGALLVESDGVLGRCTNKLFYLAVPPQLYSSIFSHLARSGLMYTCTQEGAWSRLLVEKPFGRDIATAEALERQLTADFTDEQVYRIDHYLAKDTIENIIALRFGNRLFSSVWSGAHIERISIRMWESNDVATRGAFYDGVGALRDVGQNHVLQILALLTMAPDDLLSVTSLRSARAAILSALTPPSYVVRGQYEGYRDTPGVEPTSTTETYFRLQTSLALPAWRDVPIVLEAGKALARPLLEAVVTFRPVSAPFVAGLQNVLRITMAPVPRITLSVATKQPGFGFTLTENELVLATAPESGSVSPEAYERVLYDCIVGDQTRFVSSEEVAAAWRFITPLLQSGDEVLALYPVGSAGPRVA
jgi:glucose-6-phosphate 1-dehydrogenase